MADSSDDDDEVARAMQAASAVALERFRALMDGRESGGDPVSALVSGVEAPSLAPGVTLHQYRLVRELGAGGMGTVFLAERADGQFQKQVAIKVLRGFATEAGIRRLRQERQILAELDHPNIARLLDGGETADGQPWLAMELIEGTTLYEAVAQQRLGLGARVALLRRIAEAVAHAHQRLVVHRDLKPTNVMVTPDGTPRLLDFGVARLLADATDDKSTRVFSVGYASPEQLAGLRVTTRTDVFALGVLLLELVTGARADGSPIAPALPAVEKDLDLRGIALMASAARPEDRYPTVDALLEDLERWRQGRPVRARPDTLLYRGSRFARRHWRGVALALVALAAATAFLVRLQLETRRAQRAEAAAVEARERAERQAQRARRLLDFLGQTFDAAAPDNAKGRPLTAVELVADAQARLDDALTPAEDRPAVQLMLADLASRLGESERALTLSAQAVASLHEPADRAGALWAAEVWEQRSSALDGAGEAEQAVAAARTALALLDRFAPDDAAARDAATLRLGLSLSMGGDEAARAPLEQVLAVPETQPPSRTMARIQASRALCDLALLAQDGPRALEESHRTLRLLEALPPNHPLRHLGASQEARALQTLGRLDEALALQRKAIAAWEQAFGAHGARAAHLYGDLAALLSDLGRFREAGEAIERSRALLLEVGDTGLTRAIADANAASIIESGGDYPRAEALLRSALEHGAALPPLPRQSLESNLARVAALQGRYAEARPELRRLLALAAEAQPDGALVAMNAVRLAQLELWAGRPKEARAALGEGAPAFASYPPPARWQVSRTDALVTQAEGRADAAERSLAALELEGVKLWGAESYDVAVVRAERAEAAAKLGEVARARALLELALPVLRRAVSPAQHDRALAEALAARLPHP